MNFAIYLIPWLASLLIVLLMLRSGSPFAALLRVLGATISAHGAKNAVSYLIGACLVLGATLTGFYDNFNGLTPEAWSKLGSWQVLALICKSLSAAPAALVGYLIKSPVSQTTQNNEK